MAQEKEIVKQIKLQVTGGAATPAPPVGPALGQAQVPVGEFVQRFNAATQDQKGVVLPIIIRVFSDRTFDFLIKSPPASVLVKKAAGLASGSKEPGRIKAGQVTRKQLEEIVETKKKDLNARDVEHGVRIIAGTARSMGIEVVD